jgi:gas vesicle protein
MGRQAKDTAREAAEQTKRKATEYADQAKTRGVAMLEEQRHNAASQLQTVGEAVHRAADKFREERDEHIAGYVDAMADEVDRCARYLEQRDAQALLRDTQQFARRNPEWFLGGMFLAGLALSRFLKASRPEESRQPYAGDGGGVYRERPDAPGITDPTRATATMPAAGSSIAGASTIPEPDTMPSLPGERGTVC